MGTDGGAKREEEAGCAAGHVFPAPGRLRQEDLHKFKASLGDILRSHPPQKIQKQNTQYKTKKEGTGKGIPTLLKLLGSVSPYHQIAARNDMEVSKRVSVLRLWPNPFSGSEEGQGQNPECPKGRALGAGGGGSGGAELLPAASLDSDDAQAHTQALSLTPTTHGLPTPTPRLSEEPKAGLGPGASRPMLHGQQGGGRH